MPKQREQNSAGDKNKRGVVGREYRFDRGVKGRELVEEVVEKIVEFYGCTDKAKERGLSVEVEVVSDEDFLREIRLYFEGIGAIAEEFEELDDEKKVILNTMGIDPEEKKINRKERIKKLEESVVRWGGCVVKTKDGRDKILIKEGSGTDKDEILTHELVHVMAGEDGEGGRRLTSEGGEGNKLNEAVTQLLVLRMKYKEMPQEEMLERINKGEMETGYVKEIHKLLLLLEATKLSENPVKLEEIADVYFSDEEAGVKRYLLLMKILSKIPKRIRSQSERIYNKYLA